MSYGSETDAQALFTALTADDTIVVPVVDLSSITIPGTDWLTPITKLQNTDITTGEIKGTGTFDIFMSGMAAQLKEEYSKNRITGAEYTKAFIAMVQGAMQFSVQFLLGRDQAYWAAMQAQIASVTAQVALATAKLQYAAVELEVLINKANYALTKIKLSTEDAQYGAVKFNVDNLLPQQLAVGAYNLDNMLPVQYATAEYNLGTMLPAQLGSVEQQIAQSEAQVLQINAQVLQIEQQTLLTEQQILSVEEQTEATRAQTLDTRIDGITPVAGVLGMQKNLYAQQISSYKRDAENKAAKIWSDAWITMLTINESTPVPGAFTNANLDIMLNTLAVNNDFPTLVPMPTVVGTDPLDPTGV